MKVRRWAVLALAVCALQALAGRAFGNDDVKVINTTANPVPVKDAGATAGANAPTTGSQIMGKDSAGKSQLYGIGANKGFTLGTSVTLGDGLGNTGVLPDSIGGVNNSGPLPIVFYGFNGATWDRVRVASINKDLSAVTITTITTVWTPASGKKFRIMGGSISVSAAMSVLFEDNSGGNTIFRTPKLAADTPYNFVVYGGQGRLSATADNVLKATGSAAGAITGTIYGTEE